MKDPVNSKNPITEDRPDRAPRYHKKDFWGKENLKWSQPHYRLEKSARIITKLAGGEERTLLDVGCGAAALTYLLPANIQYYGIDIAIHKAAPNLIEADFLEGPIKFGDQQFDIVTAQGVFEYVGDFQSQKLSEIAELLSGNGIFIVSYVNFGHRDRVVYGPYNNIQPIHDFRNSLERYFKIRRFFPTAHNWNHTEPNRELIRAANMHLNVNIPFISPSLAVEYFFICSSCDLAESVVPILY